MTPEKKKLLTFMIIFDIITFSAVIYWFFFRT
jgi:hypothetical protein